MKFEWEEIDNNSAKSGESWWDATYRAKIIGGWLIRYECAHEYIYYDDSDIHHADGEEWNKRFYTMVFVPDAFHEWEIE